MTCHFIGRCYLAIPGPKILGRKLFPLNLISCITVLEELVEIDEEDDEEDDEELLELELLEDDDVDVVALAKGY